MQFQGRILKVMPTTTGTKADGSTWTRQDFVFEYFENAGDRWADRVALSVMNDKIKEYDIHEGEEVIIGFGHTVREYNGKVYNDMRVYHFEKIVQREQPSPSFLPPQEEQLTF